MSSYKQVVGANRLAFFLEAGSYHAICGVDGSFKGQHFDSTQYGLELRSEPRRIFLGDSITQFSSHDDARTNIRFAHF